MAKVPLSREALTAQIQRLARDPRSLLDRLPELLPLTFGPTITSFSPIQGHPGTVVEIVGSNFSPSREDNEVSVGGAAAYVLDASPTRLTVITGLTTQTGPVKVEVATHSATGPVDFTVLPAPTVAAGQDGPPLFYEGRGHPLSGGGQAPAAGLSAQGTIRALVVLCHPQDRVPANLAATRGDVMTEFDNAPVYYDQVSYGDTDLQLTYTDWVELTGDYDDYIDSSIDNFAWPADRILAEAAQGAVDQGVDLDDYMFMAVVMNLGGGFARAWGGWSQSNFSYNGNGLNINITTAQPLGLTTIGENADWGRFAHELAHSLVDAGAVLGEDIYDSDLIDPGVASAERFDLLGDHDSHPCFSGHFMQQLGYYDSSNVAELQWDRNPFSQSYTLVAHGATQNASSGRRHLLKITVGSGLFYYVEVRQRMSGPTLYDTNLPIGASANGGGLVVTKVFTDQVNLNQEMRFITLLHDVETQDVGAVIEDPARGLSITVDSVVQANPLTLSVTVAWAQTIGDNPEGTFDLRLTQASQPWISDDIWVDRQPWGITNETDGDGRIVATREKPRPGEVNHLFGQVFNSGPDDATNVKLTYYSISPPGVGDNGAWAPIGTRTIPSVAAGTVASDNVNWTPLVGEHTCLKIFASPQFGEITGSNNQAQENVFYFAPPASSPPEPVRMRFAVRNPLDEETPILLVPTGVPTGYLVHLPHRWVILPAKGERILHLTIVPFLDISAYREKFRFRSANIDLKGFVPHAYQESLEVTGIPAFAHRAIGGITANVTPKHRAEIRAEKDPAVKDGMGVRGTVRPAMAGQKVTVVVQPVGGECFLVEAMTDGKGQFRVRIDPRTAARGTEQRPWDGTRADRGLAGIYEVACELFDAKDLAFARSQPLYFDLGKKRVEERPKRRVPGVKLAETAVVAKRTEKAVRPAAVPTKAKVAAADAAIDDAEVDDAKREPGLAETGAQTRGSRP